MALKDRGSLNYGTPCTVLKRYEFHYVSPCCESSLMTDLLLKMLVCIKCNSHVWNQRFRGVYYHSFLDYIYGMPGPVLSALIGKNQISEKKLCEPREWPIILKYCICRWWQCVMSQQTDFWISSTSFWRPFDYSICISASGTIVHKFPVWCIIQWLA